MMRNLGGAVGIAVCAAIINSRTNHHFLDIASNLTTARAPVDALMAQMTSRFTPLLGSPAAGHAAALRQLHSMAYAQAATMAYADAFRAVMFAFAVATPLVLLMRKVAAPAKPPADAH
jgi:DHA2 family multidrug resistance protein